jgi:hypothetical protein
MRVPTLRGVIDRRMLINFRVDPAVLAALLPAPFRPKLVGGFGMVGICLIRLRGVRPGFVPSWLGFTSENAAHRAAVVWPTADGEREGVYVRRRDTNSRLTALVGGRLFPGVAHHARFTVHETAEHFEVALRSDDGATDLAVVADVAPTLPSSSIFTSLAEASAFFQGGALGYSATPDPTTFHGMELHCRRWHVEPLTVREVRSSYFDDETIFPKGSIAFDNALLMRGIEHEWRGRADLCCPAARGAGFQPAAVIGGKHAGAG